MSIDKTETDTVMQTIINIAASINPLVSSLNKPVRLQLNQTGLPSEKEGTYHAVLKMVETLYTSSKIELIESLPNDINAFELSIQNHLILSIDSISTESANHLSADSIKKLAPDFLNGKRSAYTKHVMANREGININFYTAGKPENPPIILISACGMPVELSIPWLDYLSQKYFIVTWETRGLFSSNLDSLNINSSVDNQVNDLIDLTQHLSLSNTHLMGFCGGAVIALHACNRESTLFISASVWHGDYDFSGECEKTEHQKNVETMMEIGGESREMASSCRTLMLQPSVLDSLPTEVAHLVLYPYTTDELFFNYCRLNGEIMKHDISQSLQNIHQPTLVVTSLLDNTAHPQGSKKLANLLKNATLVEEPSGDHLSLFSAPENLILLADNFISKHHLA